MLNRIEIIIMINSTIYVCRRRVVSQVVDTKKRCGEWDHSYILLLQWRFAYDDAQQDLTRT